MPRPKDTSYEGDPEYTKFEQMITDRKLCPATAKTYKASYRKIRNLFQEPLRDTAEDTAWKTIQVAEDGLIGHQLASLPHGRAARTPPDG